MAKKKPFERIADTSRTYDRIDPSEIKKGLGASIAAKAPAHPNPFSLMALRTRVANDLVSTGGRPARREATSLKKIPLTQSEWGTLEEMAQLLKRRGVKATSGQVAGVLLNQSILEFRKLNDTSLEMSDKTSPQDLSDRELEQTVEGILSAAASAEVHLEQLRPVALELLRRMRRGKGAEADDDSEE